MPKEDSRSPRKRVHRPTSLTLPELEQSKAALLSALPSPNSRMSYDHAITAFISWYCTEPRFGFNRSVVMRYRSFLEGLHLSSATINLKLSAIRRLAHEAVDSGLLSPELGTGIVRVKGIRLHGQRMGNWLGLQEARHLIEVASQRNSLRGKRDAAILALFLGCGLRRTELVDLCLEQLQQRDQHWVIIDLVGKGGRLRTVPVPLWAKERIDRWTKAAGIKEKRIFRSLKKKHGVIGESLTAHAVWAIVREYAKYAGIEHLAPHDLRRSCARLCHAAGGELEQIQFLLGHSSVKTTERYIGCKQKLREAVNDRLGLFA